MSIVLITCLLSFLQHRHCTEPGAAESESALSCERVERDYNVPLRIGTLFVVLVTSSIGM